MTTTVIQGVVIDELSQKGIPYASITIYEINPNVPGAFGTKYFAQKKTDASGNFSFNFDMDEAKTYRIDAYANMYNSSVGQTPIPFEENDYRFLLHPIGFVKFHIKNVNPYDSSDYFFMNYTVFKGTTIDTFLTYPGSAYTSCRTNYTYIKNNQTIDNYKTVTLPAFDTILVDINY
jgi:hypothetical protein